MSPETVRGGRDWAAAGGDDFAGRKGPSLDHMRILVVDDYPDAAEIACTLLGMMGHECRAVSSGTEALAEAARFDPDVVLLDIGLPDINGYDVARTLRSRAGERPLHLAAVTGWGQSDDKTRALAAGFDQHVLKPTNAAKLRDIISRAARRRAPVARH